MNDWQNHAAGLAGQIAARVGAGSPWSGVFAEVPRHVFAPTPAREPLQLPHIAGFAPPAWDGWLDAAYQDKTLTAEQGPGRPYQPGVLAPQPSVLALMLDLADLADGDRVLHVGTGTGYTAALLCQRLGDAAVTTIELDESLVDTARRRLAGLDFYPHVTVGDGAAGYPPDAPYERIVSTCSVPRVPPAWIEQLTDDGLIVTELHGTLTSRLLLAHRTAPTKVCGAFSATTAGLSPILTSPIGYPGQPSLSRYRTPDFTEPQAVDTLMPIDDLDHPDFRFWLQFAVPGLDPVNHTTRAGASGRYLTASDNTWAELEARSPVGSRATYGRRGRPLWAMVEIAWLGWIQHGRPSPDRLGLTATVDGQTRLWLDDHDQVLFHLSDAPVAEPEPVRRPAGW